MQRDYLPTVPESCGMCSERLHRITTMLEGMVADKSAQIRRPPHCHPSCHRTANDRAPGPPSTPSAG